MGRSKHMAPIHARMDKIAYARMMAGAIAKIVSVGLIKMRM